MNGREISHEIIFFKWDKTPFRAVYGKMGVRKAMASRVSIPKRREQVDRKSGYR
jgi:hypothetical protein